MLRLARRQRRRWAAAVIVYGAFLLVSHAIRARSVRREPPDAAGPSVATNVVDGEELEIGSVRVAYVDRPPQTPEEPSSVTPRRSRRASTAGAEQTLLLIHGSPGHKEDFDRIAPRLPGRLIVPDLPGFGASSRVVPDYSFRAHAGYVSQLLDAIGVDRVHVVAFSMGGGVGIHLADAEPQRVESLTLLSAIGVQEMELTGSYALNHFVHGAQLAALTALYDLTPHMGWLDDSMLSREYARNFLDSDQRSLRAMLSRVRVPTLIVHGRNDTLVPVEAAVEHHRLIPQSELTVLDAGHFMVFRDSDRVGDTVARFVTSVAEGRAVAYDGARPDRLAAAQQPWSDRALPPLRGIASGVASGLVAAATLVVPPAGATASGWLVGRGRLATAAGTTSVGVALLVHVLVRWWRRGGRARSTGRLLAASAGAWITAWTTTAVLVRWPPFASMGQGRQLAVILGVNLAAWLLARTCLRMGSANL